MKLRLEFESASYGQHSKRIHFRLNYRWITFWYRDNMYINGKKVPWLYWVSGRN